jgi:hypothetical protein
MEKIVLPFAAHLRPDGLIAHKQCKRRAIALLGRQVATVKLEGEPQRHRSHSMPMISLALALKSGKFFQGSLNSAVQPHGVLSAATSAPWSLKSSNAGKSRTASRGLISVFVNGVQNMCSVPGPNWAAPSCSPRRVSR